MGVAEHLVGRELSGRKKSKWKVIQRIHREQDGPDGLFYSVGYKVQAEDGREAFMKATDVDLLTHSDHTMFQRTSAALQQHDIETKIL